MRLSSLLLPALLLSLPIAAHADPTQALTIADNSGVFTFDFTSGPEVGSFSAGPSQITDLGGDLSVSFSDGTGSFSSLSFVTFYSSADGGGYNDSNDAAFEGFAGPSVVSGTSFAPGSYSFTEFAPTSATPEPSSLVLLGTGVLGLAGAVRRRLSK